MSLIDEPQIIALTNAMKVNVEVAYVDGHTTSDIVKFLRIHNAQDENSRSIMLLYRYALEYSHCLAYTYLFA